ncbi:DUF6456 domain-containing protein [Cognatishimia sp. MH4019]|uniref:DUF6456 domain-containing protein n=1 Tax=Cognatishimia sp. MH4019 TaxID=2854030 RepID=UPI001CD664EF|nr:DUF6456 domain-containing protein [Cognatishimia sp. MH4019]
MPDDQSVEALSPMPAWVPDGARLYLTHVEGGVTIRGLARSRGVHASTIMRQVRRFEQRRDDPLVDKALRRLASKTVRAISLSPKKECRQMLPTQSPIAETTTAPDPLLNDAHRALRRLCETGAILAIAADMEKAVVVRNGPDGSSTRTAVIDRSVAEAMALKDWIACDAPGRISRYEVTPTGRAAARELAVEADDVAPAAATEDTSNRRARYGAVESPLISLSRRRDKDGNVFLSEDLVTAGERLREDFELGQLGPYAPADWEAFLNQAPETDPSKGAGVGPDAARARVHAALTELGPSLADIALRCCCFLEGLEVTEKQMGWSARSGKIVLRIALQRLSQHYLGQRQDYGKLIG